MLWIGRKNGISNIQKTTYAPTNAPISFSEPNSEAEINNQLTILKEKVQKNFDDGKGDFLTVGVLPRGRLTHSYPTNTYLHSPYAPIFHSSGTAGLIVRKLSGTYEYI